MGRRLERVLISERVGKVIGMVGGNERKGGKGLNIFVITYV